MMEEDVSEESLGGGVEVEGHPEVDFPALRVCQEDSDVSWEGELSPELWKGSGTAQTPTTTLQLMRNSSACFKGTVHPNGNLLPPGVPLASSQLATEPCRWC